MFDIDYDSFETRHVTGKLRRVSLTEIQNAISEALRKVVGEDDPAQQLHVSITSLEFGDNNMRAKMAMTLYGHYELAADESAKDQATSPTASH
jgi:hypothetical protein